MADETAMWRAFGTWIAGEVNGCSCGGDGRFHEPGCGYEPLFQVTTEAEAVVAAYNALAARLAAAEKVVEEFTRLHKHMHGGSDNYCTCGRLNCPTLAAVDAYRTHEPEPEQT